MEGGHLVVGVEDKTLRIVGTDSYNYTTQQATLRLTNLCANLSSEGLDIEEFIVGVRLYGNAINEKYTKILKENKTLTLQECIALDAVQKGHQINEETAEELLDKGLIEGESPNYQISLGVAKITHQLPEYTRVSGLERSKLKQMTLQFIQNAGEDGTMRDGIYEYLKVAMPSNKTKEQNLRLLGNILKELKEEGAVSLKGLSWYEVQNPTKKN